MMNMTDIQMKMKNKENMIKVYNTLHKLLIYSRFKILTNF